MKRPNGEGPVRGSPDDLDALAGDLLELIGYLRRSLRHRVYDQDTPQQPLSGSQNELLRIIRDRPGITVGEAAAALHLAANTVSTLVSSLDDLGFVVRRRDTDDGRVTRLYLSAVGGERLQAARDRRRHFLRTALVELSPASRRLLADALPALRELVDHVEEGPDRDVVEDTPGRRGR